MFSLGQKQKQPKVPEAFELFVTFPSTKKNCKKMLLETQKE